MPVPKHIVDAVIDNANRHYEKHGLPIRNWTPANDRKYLCALMEELGEASSAIEGEHEDPVELEVMQIAGACLNWLSARGATEDQMFEASRIERARHGWY